MADGNHCQLPADLVALGAEQCGAAGRWTDNPLLCWEWQRGCCNSTGVQSKALLGAHRCCVSVRDFVFVAVQISVWL